MARGAFGRATPWLLLALPLLLLFLFLLLPYLLTFYYSTTGATIGRLLNVKEVGLKNFLALHTVSAGVRSALLAVYLIPWVIAAVIIGYTWRLIYDPAIGLANSVLGALGVAPIDWLTTQGIAIFALVVANVWAGYGIVLLVVSGALANVPPNIILAGQVDGASYGRIVRRVILPAIRPTFLLAALVALVSGLNTFDLIYAMTRGGPLYHTETMALEMYRLTALKGNVGQGASVTVILFTVSLALAVAYVIVWRREARKWS